MLSPVARFVHLASVVICLIVIASFGVFAINQTNTASAHQQQTLNESAPPGTQTSPASTDSSSSGEAHKSAAHKALDEASDTLTSPFSGVSARWSSEWAKRAVGTLLALLVYGFGLGYLGRMIRAKA